MKSNERLVDDLAKVIRDSRGITGALLPWDQLIERARDDYRKQARAVLSFLAEDEEPIPPAHMPLEQLASLLYNTYNRYYGRLGPALSTESPAKRGPYLAMAQEVIDAGQAPKVAVDWREMLSAATVPTFIQVPAPATVTVNATPKPLPGGLKEEMWVGRFQMTIMDKVNYLLFLTESAAKAWLAENRLRQIFRIHIDWAQRYDTKLVPVDE